MATLTYDPSETPEGELTAEEQDSLQVGEQLAQQEAQLLAGKFESQEDLENAYLELQRKLGEQSEEEEEYEEGEEYEEDEDVEFEEIELTQEHVDQIMDMAGGPEGYRQITEWAAENLPKDQVELFDYVIDQANPAAMAFAVRALIAEYTEANGYEGELLTGRSAEERADIFRSQAEVVRAMSDPRYESDPAYRDDVYAKLERSGELQW